MSESDPEDWGWKRNVLSYSNVEPSGQQWSEENDGELLGYPLSRWRTCGVHGRNPKLLTGFCVCVCVCVWGGGGGATAQHGSSPPHCLGL
jgi:hypothetical protein